MKRNKSHNKGGMPSQRQLRAGEQVKQELTTILYRGHFDDASLMEAGRITITEVRMSPDLKHATAYVMPLGGKDADTIIPALNESAKIFQMELGRVLEMKFTPRVKFVLDHSFGEAEKIESILHKINQSKKNSDDA